MNSPADTQTTDRQRRTRASQRVAVALAIFSLLLAGYALWRSDLALDRESDTRERLQQLEHTHAVLRGELNTAIEREMQARAALQKQWDPLLAQLTDLPKQMQDLAASHDDLRARTERPQRAWSRAEALYLIELAQQRLSFDRDVATAIAALQSADARLASLRDSSLNGVRELLAKDLQALRGVAEPDRAGIMARLSAIEQQIERLPLKGVLVGQRSTTTPSTADGSWWLRTWNALAGNLRNMFVVRRLREGDAALVTLEEQALRRQHFALLAFSARHAVLRNQQAAYQASLEEMRTWLQQYFAATPATAALMSELEALRAINVAPPLPDISKSAQLLSRVTPSS